VSTVIRSVVLVLAMCLPAMAASAQAPAQAPASPAQNPPDPADLPPIVQVEPGDFPRGFSPEQIRRIQEDLLAMAIDPGPVDGLMGPRTRSGINEFIQLVFVDLPRTRDFDRQLLALINGYAGVTASPRKDDWKNILQDEAFQLWVDENPQRLTAMRRSGTTAQIVAILTEWLNRGRPPTPPPAKIPSIHDIADYETTPLRWGDTSDCGCLQNFGDRSVYGLYPFWLAGNRDATGIDFSVLSRVGYFAVPLDDDGVDVSHSGHWETDSAAFIDQARRYDTSVDLVVYNDKWSRWTAPNAGFLDRLAGRIAGMVTEPLRNSALNRMIPAISLGSDPVPTMGDGVTLYFDVSSVDDRPPAEHQAIFANIRSFIGELRRRLRGDREDRQVNLLLRMDDLVGDSGVFRFDNLYQLSTGANQVLVLLPPPTSTTRRALRDAIERAAPDAAAERNLLRKVVPILDPRGLSAQGRAAALADDLVYFEDNFGGAGFLPVPLAPDAAVNATVSSIFVDSSGGDLLQPIAVVCDVVCPNGWWFILAFELMLVLALAMVVAWLSSAEVRIAFDRLWLVGWLVAAVTLLLGVALYLCDKFFRGYRDEIFVAFVLAAATTLAVRIWRRRQEAAYP
jgi:hypothetical protein